MKSILYLIIWANGHEEKVYVYNWKNMEEYLDYLIQRYGLPDLIYRKA